MTLALSQDFPILDVFWTMLLIFGFVLFFWLLVVVFRDLFGRNDISVWGKTGWVVLVLFLPIIGALAYLASRSTAMGERALRRDGATDLRMDSYTRSVAGGDGFYGVRDEVETRQVMGGPVRPG